MAFVSPVSGIAQVFLMLTSGGEPLQLTNDEGDKDIDNFSSDGKEIYYQTNLGRDETWSVPTLGGSPRLLVAARWMVPSSDGASIFYAKSEGSGIFRAGKSGLDEELVYNAKGTGLFFIPVLPFPGGNDLLAGGFQVAFESKFRFYRINLTSHAAVDLGEVSANAFDAVWAEPGKTVLFGRVVNGLTNIWSYNLSDRSLTQITFGTGPDYAPMPDPGGRGIYFVNGKSSGSLDRVPRSFEGIHGHCGGRNWAEHLARWKARDVRHVSLNPRVPTLGVGPRWWQQIQDRHRRGPVDWVLGARQFSRDV